MRILETIAAMQAAGREWRAASSTIGLVPTLGALHEGHLSLMRAARSECDVVVASIFVNPTQFGPTEDFAKYPRTFEEDCARLKAEGVDAVFAPTTEEMYPAGASTYVVVEGLSDRLDGASRPGHFRGVTTVVAKLFHIVGPQRAFFGQKDAAQVAVLRRMVRDLNFDLELVVCPIVREPDGLAMSSRNRYLDGELRQRALALRRAILRAEELAADGVTSAAELIRAARTELSGVRVDYVAAVNAETLEPVEDIGGGALFAVAAWVGDTRLIDNVVFGIVSAEPA